LGPGSGRSQSASIRQALLDHLVIFFRGQDITPEQQLAFARRWGDIHLHPFMKGMDDHPELLEIKKTPTDTKNFGGAWHSDQMFSPQPAMGTILYAREVPSKGGDTLFTNQYLAYETLSDGLKETLAGLRAISVGDRFKSAGGKTRKEMYAGRTSMQVKDPGNVQTTSSHPVVRTHPETGRKALYVGGHCQYFDGLTDAESEPLLDYLRQHSIKPEFQCRFRWEPGSVALWDNRCTHHFALNDYHGHRRRMHRCTIEGDRPS
jgi:taurine dioxygenase